MKYKFKASLLLAPVITLSSLFVPAHADTTYAGIPATTSDRFGGKAAMDIWARDLNAYVQGDTRISQIFRFGGDTARQKALQNDIEQMVLTSPVESDQAKAIADKYHLALTKTQFNAVIDNAYMACEASHTSFHVCNQIVAALAPFGRAAVSR